MIATNAHLTIERIPLSCLVVTEQASCFPEKFAIYLDLLTKHPEQDVEPIIVESSTMHDGIFVVRNGKHRLAASIMAGRKDLLCIVVKEGY